MGDKIDIKEVDYNSFLLTTNPKTSFGGQQTIIRKDDLEIRVIEEDGLYSQLYSTNMEYGTNHYKGLNVVTFLIKKKDENRVYSRIKIAKQFVEQEPKRATEYALGIALARYYRTEQA